MRESFQVAGARAASKLKARTLPNTVHAFSRRLVFLITHPFVICASVLDHLISPGTVLQEIHPIIKPQGNLFVWSGIYRTPFEEAISYMKKSTRLLREAFKKRDLRHFKESAYYGMRCAQTIAAISLGRRHQIEDPHHFTRFSVRSIVALIGKSGYGISRLRLYENSVIVRANKKKQ